MKAPDKIYLAESDNIRGEVTSNFASSTPFRKHGSIAYIRKDVLLEWAKKNNKRIDTEDGDYTLGYVSAMIDLIEKLNTI